MGDENPIRTLGDYSRPSHESYRNTIEFPEGNNMVPLRSGIIRLVQNGCSFHGLRSEDPNQHLKDFFKLVDSLDLDGENKERTHLHHGLVSRTYSKKSLIMASIVGFKSRFFMIMSPFILSARLTAPSVANSAIRMHESWEIIENLALYDHEGWYKTKEFVKPIKAISTPPVIPKTPDRRLLELEDQINFLLKGSWPTPTPSSGYTPQAYVNAVYPNSRPRNQNEPPTLSTFAFCERIGPSPQPQALNTTFEAQIRDYMAAHTKRMERFENTIFKQREEINGRMTEMFRLLKELTTSITPEKVLIREESKFPVTKNLNSISLRKEEERGSDRTMMKPNNAEKPTETKTKTPIMEVEEINEVENEAKIIKTSKNNEAVEAPGSQPVAYYLKHKINEKLIKGLVNNNRFNNSRSTTQAGKKKGKEYKVLPGGTAYDEILKKMITKKEDIGGNFGIPCSIRNLKHTDIRLSLASHSYIYPLGITEDVLVEIAEHVYPVDFVILDIRENKIRSFILGTPFLTTAKASIKFDTGTITLRSGKHKISFHRKPDSSNMIDKGVKNDIEPISPTMTVNKLVREWEEKIKLHLEREIQFYQWRSKNFKGMHPTFIATKEIEMMDNEEEVT
uniref:MAK10-like protein n=1 Tax=Tanacetum cinerariifolium TaxID=118510 RepID=A0A6L2M8R8_TANCI|nr:MAK10-like protein [Tanacetum cinerariifolium]